MEPRKEKFQKPYWDEEKNYKNFMNQS